MKNEDFEKKCKTFSMYQQFRKKLLHDFKASHPTYDSAEDKGFEVVENGKVVGFTQCKRMDKGVDCQLGSPGLG